MASSTFDDRAGQLTDPPPVALLGPGGVEWLHRGPVGEPALLWADTACLVEVLEGRATTLGALLAGAARCETTTPPWEWTRRQAALHEGDDSVVGRLPATGKAPKRLRSALARAAADGMRDQLRFYDYQESQRSDVHVRWTTPNGEATTKVGGGTYAACDGSIEGDALVLRIDERDVLRVLRRETRIADLVLEGRVTLEGEVAAVSLLPPPQF